jgi:N-methylhydantoinase B
MVETVDPITLDIIENALKNARFEMDGIVCRISLSPVIREQHDEFPMICNHRGQMVVGQFGSYIPGVVEKFAGDINDGDVFVWNDPYACKGSISHNNDWCVMMPIFHETMLVGFSSIFGHMVDVGGKVPGSMPADARSIWEEGLRIPPVRIYDRGTLNQGVLDIMLNNTRTPDMNRSDLMALIAGCKLAGTRVRELCDRFGCDTYMTACDLLLDRTRGAMRVLIQKYIPEEVVSFTDYVDDDGRGNGPFKMTLSIYRRGDTAVFDWTGTDDQAEGPINFHIHEGLCKLFFGVYMIMAFDPSILFNEGFYDLFEVILPEGSLLNPRFPAALSNRLI